MTAPENNGPPTASGPAALAAMRQIYATALSGSATFWDVIFWQCAQLMGSEVGGFVSTDKLEKRVALPYMAGFDAQRAEATYARAGIEGDRLYTASLDLSPEAVFLGGDLISMQGMRESPFYETITVPADVCHVIGGILENNTRYHSALYFWRAPHDPPFDAQSVGLLAATLPHIRQALEIRQRLREPQPGAAIINPDWIDLLYSARRGILLLDEAHHAVHQNGEARRILAAGDGLTLRHGKVHIDNGKTQGGIETLLQHTHEGRPGDRPHGIPTLVSRPSGQLPYEIVARPAAGTAEYPLLPPGVRTILAITDPATFSHITIERLRDWGLTRAEARLAQALVQHNSLSRAAAHLSIRPGTARAHLKHIYAKLGLNSQVQLAMLLASSLPAPRGTGPPHPAGGAKPDLPGG